MSTASESTETRASRRFGWTSLAVWIVAGLALEAAHGFKASAYLDDSLTRALLRLGHAHGVILALAVLVYGHAAGAETPPLAGRLLRLGALLVPAGFALSAFRHGETDPSLPILLVPLGGGALATAAVILAVRAWRR